MESLSKKILEKTERDNTSEVDRRLIERFKHVRPGMNVYYEPLEFEFLDSMPEGEDKEKMIGIIKRVWK